MKAPQTKRYKKYQEDMATKNTQNQLYSRESNNKKKNPKPTKHKQRTATQKQSNCINTPNQMLILLLIKMLLLNTQMVQHHETTPCGNLTVTIKSHLTWNRSAASTQ